MIVGLIPAVSIGVTLLYFLVENRSSLTRNIFGWAIIVGAVLLILRPHPHSKVSSGYVAALAGAAGGIFGGLFGASGPPIVFFMYRQPLILPVVRSTLLAIFVVGGAWRTVHTAVIGQLSTDIIVTVVLAAPLTYFTALAGAWLTPRVPVQAVRWVVFVLLVLTGIYLALPL